MPAQRAAPAAVCAWCGSAARPGDARLAHCGRCGAASTYPPPSEDELGERVRATGTGPPRGVSPRGVTVCCAARARRWRAGSMASRPPGPVLDVGCGEGALLDALRARGREAIGLERVLDAARRARGRADRVQERAGEWAAVVFWHSLEHLRQPGRGARPRRDRCWPPAGCSSSRSPTSRRWQSRRFGTRWFALDIPRHLVHLPAAALIDGLRARGLQRRAGQLLARRAGAVRLAARARRRASGTARPVHAIRRPAARGRRLSPAARVVSLAAGAALVAGRAGALGRAEVGARAGGTVYVEARRP